MLPPPSGAWRRTAVVGGEGELDVRARGQPTGGWFERTSLIALDGDRSGLPGARQPSSPDHSRDDASRTLVGQRGKGEGEGAGAHSRATRGDGPRTRVRRRATKDPRPKRACQGVPTPPSTSECRARVGGADLHPHGRGHPAPVPEAAGCDAPWRGGEGTTRSPTPDGCCAGGGLRVCPDDQGAPCGPRSAHRASSALPPLVRQHRLSGTGSTPRGVRPRCHPP